ncbi:hypothetical protein [Aquisediminimonas profunda]|uniref:hypothetical protein n=1 Tax=Aquisediminimonas profunda TaxID=1550733 RepID=UPI001C638944|nr:hypothetical protein [Aquisediminimonas profunda]
MSGAYLRASGATLLLVLQASAAMASEGLPVAPSPIAIAIRQPSPEKAQRLAGMVPSLPVQPVTPLPEAVRTSPFTHRLTTETSTPKTVSYSAAFGGLTLSLSAVRSKAVRIAGLSNFAHPRFANFEADLGLAADLGKRDTLGLSGNWALERRRPSVKAGSHNHYESQSRAVTLSWVHDDTFHLALSAFDVHPSSRQSPVERLSDLAAGSPRAAKGIALTMFRSIGHDPDRLSIGFDIRQQRSETALAERASLYRPETRGLLTLRARF